MDIATVPLSPLIALIAGVLILVMPRLLNYIVAIYLIIVGVLGLFPQLWPTSRAERRRLIDAEQPARPADTRQSCHCSCYGFSLCALQ